jgi:hypothetical protein
MALYDVLLMLTPKMNPLFCFVCYGANKIISPVTILYFSHKYTCMFQIFQELPDIDRRLSDLKSSDFRDAYPRFPPIQVYSHIIS